MVTLAALHREARRRLAEAGVDTPDLDARLLIEHFTGATRRDMIVAPERDIETSVAAAVGEALARRVAGEPLHRILGRREFHGLALMLSPETLEPRPDTETVVDLALPFVRRIAADRGVCRVLDLGTGTGAIALAILAAVPETRAVGADLSEGALATAAANAAALGLADRFDTARTDWFERISDRFDVIVSNPPYIRSGTIGELDRSVRDFDPHLALDGGADGLDAYRAIAAGAHGHLEADGRVVIEIGFDQRDDVTTVFAARGFRLEEEMRDLGGHVRALAFAG